MSQKAFLIGIKKIDESRDKAINSLEEAALLSETAGAVNVGNTLRTIKSIDPAYFISKGMLEEIKESIISCEADIAIIDVDLSPSQERNLSEFFDINVIDRTRLILDIFATRAGTSEGKLQVELALLNYILPRLKGSGAMLSRTGAGIGTRGPGETKLETDRRRIRHKITHIKEKLKLVERTRLTQRCSREKQGLSTVTIVGYTNAGKTSVLKAFTGKGKDGENKLFATLGTKMASIFNKNTGKKIIVSDTVGFIQNLPTFLIESFKATLEEVVCSDVLILVIDPIGGDVEGKFKNVIDILDSIGAGNKKMIIALNKIDILEDGHVDFLKSKFERLAGKIVIPVSAKTGKNIGLLKENIFNFFN